MKSLLGDGKLAVIVTAVLFALALFAALPDHARELSAHSDAAAFVAQADNAMHGSAAPDAISDGDVRYSWDAMRSAGPIGRDRLVLAGALHVRFKTDDAVRYSGDRRAEALAKRHRDASTEHRLPVTPTQTKR